MNVRPHGITGMAVAATELLSPGESLAVCEEILTLLAAFKKREVDALLERVEGALTAFCDRADAEDWTVQELLVAASWLLQSIEQRARFTSAAERQREPWQRS